MVKWTMCSGLIKTENYRILWNHATIMTALTMKRSLCNSYIVSNFTGDFSRFTYFFLLFRA